MKNDCKRCGKSNLYKCIELLGFLKDMLYENTTFDVPLAQELFILAKQLFIPCLKLTSQLSIAKCTQVRQRLGDWECFGAFGKLPEALSDALQTANGRQKTR